MRQAPYELALESQVSGARPIYRFHTADGVRSKRSFRNAELLLVEALWDADPGHLLSLEANYGVVGVVLADRSASVRMVESSARATRLCERNAIENSVDASVSLVADVTALDDTFDTVAYAPKALYIVTLPKVFEANRFKSALAVGTQVSLSRSMQGLRQFLRDLSYVTTPDATAVIDGYDPDHETTKEKLDYYDDPATDLVYRLLQIEYDGMLGEPWLYRLFTPDRVREVATDTGWEVAEITYEPEHLYQLALRKR